MQPVIFRADNYKKKLLGVLLMVSLITYFIIINLAMDFNDFPALHIISIVFYLYYIINEYTRKLVIDDQGITVHRLFREAKTIKWEHVIGIRHYMIMDKVVEYMLFDQDVNVLDVINYFIIPNPYNKRIMLLPAWDNHAQIKLLAEKNIQPQVTNQVIVPFIVSRSAYMKQIFLLGVVIISVILVFG